MSRARVGLDVRLTRQMSVGMKTYAREVAARLERVAPEYEYVRFSRGGNFGWSEQVRLPLAMRRARLNLAHFLAHYVPLGAPRPFVLTVHDLIHLRFPDQFKAKVGPYYRSVVRLVCARAARVITDDPRTVEDLERFLGVPPAKVRVVPLGVEERFFAPPDGAGASRRPYLLYVGNHREHKDLPTLFAAWRALRAAAPIDLYLTGARDFGDEPLRREDGGEVRALGEVHRDALIAYYAGARALVQPSLREGFGLPVLEAMAAGCPAVVSETAVPLALREAALRFPARDARALQEHLEGLLDDERRREEWIARGRRAAQHLTWDDCARATADIYAEVLS